LTAWQKTNIQKSLPTAAIPRIPTGAVGDAFSSNAIQNGTAVDDDDGDSENPLKRSNLDVAD